jgi:hypothetical protein
MRLRRRGGMVIGGLALLAACASSNKTNPGYDGGTVTNPDGGGGGDTGGSPMDAPNIQGDQMTSDMSSCASQSFTAQQSPAAMLLVLDASGSMGNNGKYANAQQAIVAAMDLTEFNSMFIGLLLYPQAAPVSATCPQLLGIPVNCVVSGLPQVPLALAGPDTSNTTGVRQSIYMTLANSTPQAGPGNGNPSYDALQTAVTTLKSFTQGKRLIFFITDGGASCASQDTPQRPAYTDGNGCQDWENPANFVTLLKTAHDDPTTPVNTFIVGVQGADTTNPGGTNTSLPPYSVRRALSAAALAGSAETVPMGCDGAYDAANVNNDQMDPAMPCHFDLSTTPSFGMTLANNIGLIRNRLLGCTFNLPQPDGGMVDPNKVNVDYSTNGGMPTDLKKRSNPSDQCTTDGCWDYSNGQVVLIGKACSDVQSSPSAQVDIVVGCQTVNK